MGLFRKIFLIALAGFLLVLAGTIVADWIEQSRRSAETRRRNAEAGRQQIAEQRRCITRFAARDPSADAEADLRRGDATPIGFTVFPHEGPIETSYPAAAGCERISLRLMLRGGGTSVPNNGKWLPHGTIGWGQSNCNDQTFRYIRAYNQRMSTLAPAAVARFCRRAEEEDNRRSAASPSAPPQPAPAAAAGP